ncbi:MAG: energy-coupling factor transporter ATPase [Clostridia bacterium]|nr:energy-coupling factor transporter ATPase [Clostridia bacterium]
METEKSRYIINTENLSFAYEEDEGSEPRKALDGVTLEIERGSFVAIVGRNGSGKSTLAKNFNALLLPTGGAVFVDGLNTADDSTLWNIRRCVGMVFQNPDNQLVSSVVEDDVAFGPENIGVESSEIRRRVDAALKAVNMYEHRKKGPHLLSGGQKQRVAIAGVLAMEPECIVFDEATAMLDPSGRREIMETVNRLHKEGKTVIIITHYMEEAAQADRIVVMHKGKMVMDGTPSEIFMRGGELAALNLEMPFAAKLADRLRKGGLNIPEGIITEEGLADCLCALK